MLPSLPEPLFILDDSGMVKIANPAAEEFLGGTELEGRHFAAVLRAPAVFEAVENVGKTKGSQTVEFSSAGAVERSCRAFIAPLGEERGGGDEERQRCGTNGNLRVLGPTRVRTPQGHGQSVGLRTRGVSRTGPPALRRRGRAV